MNGAALQGRGAVVRTLAAAAALVLLHVWLALSAASRMSATYDEPLHMVGGYSYVSAQDFRLQPENGNLPQRVAGTAMLRLKPTLPRDGFEQAWQTSDLATLSSAFLFDAGPDHRALLGAARRGAVLWSVALGLLIFAWSWTLWGQRAGLFSLALFALSPTMLAHGPLVTSDVSAAFFLSAATWAWWHHLQRLSWQSLIVSAVVGGLAAIAKFSAVLLPIVFLILAAWMLVSRPVWTLSVGRRIELRAWLPRIAWVALAIVVHSAVATLIIWDAYDFRYAAAGPGMPELTQFYRLWSVVTPPDSAMATLIGGMREWKLLPEAYLYGFSYVIRFASERGAFLNGEFSSTGWWWFFPYAFLVKSTLAELFALAVALFLGRLAWRRRGEAESDARALAQAFVPLVALVLVYCVVSITSSLNIGHRHLLPVYPAVFIFVGGIARDTRSWRRGMIAAALVVIAAIESFAVRPHYLAFFNSAVGGPSRGWRHLVDSSLDWGQELPAVAEFVARERQPGEALYMSLFGARRPAAFGLDGIVLAPEYADAPRPWVEWGAGLYVISATMLQDVYSPFAGPWDSQRESNFQVLSRDARAAIARDSSQAVIDAVPKVGSNFWTLERLQFARLVNYLRLRTPNAVIGYSVFAHRLTADELRIITQGDTPQYLALLDSAR